MLIYTIFWAIPIISTFLISITNWTGITAISKAKFVGMQNYIDMLSDPILKIALRNNVIYGVIMVLFVPAIAFIVAFILEKYVVHKTFFRTVIYLPAVLPGIVTVLWKKN